jgi:hypothetical protein
MEINFVESNKLVIARLLEKYFSFLETDFDLDE